MKRLIASIASTFALLLAGLGGAAASASGQWALNVEQLSTYTTSHSFNVQYTVLTTVNNPEGGTNFCVELFQDGNPTALATQNTLNPSDQNTNNGNSGTFPVTVSADGTYSYTVQAFNTNCANTEDTKSSSTGTIVDTVAPGAPNYLGKTASGSSTVVKFTAPSDSDVATVNIYAGSTKTYAGDTAHKVGQVSVSAGQTYSQTVNASSSQFFSIQAFDQAGNGSTIVGDPGTVVNPVRFVTVGGQGGGGGGGAAAGTAATGTTTGQVQGATTTTPNTSSTGQVNAPGSSNNSKNNNGKVLGAETVVNHNARTAWIASIAGAVALILLALYYWVWPRWHKQP